MKNIVCMSILLAFSLFMISCNLSNDKQEQDGVFLRSFVPVYYAVDAVEIYDSNIELGIYGFSVSVGIGEQYAFYDEGDKLSKYDALCEKHTDMTFNRDVQDYRPMGRIDQSDMIGAMEMVFVGYPDIDFTSLKVICNTYFDEQHPSGSDLGDITMLFYMSLYPYIKNGYEPFNWDAFEPEFPIDISNWCLSGVQPIYPVNKLVSELDINDLKIIGSGYENGKEQFDLSLPEHQRNLIRAVFTKTPTVTKIQDITITLTADDGRVFSDTVQVSWE